MKLRRILTAVLALAIASAALAPAHAAYFRVTSFTILSPGTIDKTTGELLNTRGRGSTIGVVVRVDGSADYLSLVELSAGLFDHGMDDTCSTSASSVGVCADTSLFFGLGHSISCAIPSFGNTTLDCDTYYDTRGAVVHRGRSFLSLPSNCAGIPCDCT